MNATATRRAFQTLGEIRERLTDLQSLAADLEDPQLSMSVRNAMLVNTDAIERVNALLQAIKRTDALDADQDSQHVEGARGG